VKGWSGIRRAAAGLGLLLLSVGAATAAGASTRVHPAVATKAFAATVQAGSAHVATTLDVKNSKETTSTISGGDFSWATNTGTITSTTSSSFGFSTSSTYVYDGKRTFWTVTSPSSTPGATSFAPTTGHWGVLTWSTDEPSLRDGFSGILGSILEPGRVSPAATLALLRTRASRVVDLGSDSVATVPTTHYRAVIGLGRVTTISPGDLRVAERELGSDALSVDFWTDSAGLLRQLSLALSLHLPSRVSGPGSALGGQTITLSSVLQLSNYGAPVQVTPPPASEITDHESCRASGGNVDCTTA
jgi:hypothetical protein